METVSTQRPVPTSLLVKQSIQEQTITKIAVRYKALDEDARRKIWESFIERLGPGEAQAQKEIRQNLDDIAHWPLNGREIRNIMTAAQSLSLSLERRTGALRFSHVEQVANETIRCGNTLEETELESRNKMRMAKAHAGPTRR